MAVEYIGNNGTDGMSMGSSTSEKVSVYGVTPVVQKVTTVTVGTDLATVILELAELRAALASFGIIDS